MKMVAWLVASAALGVAALAAPAPILVCPDGSGHASTLGEAQRLWRRQLARWGGTTVGKTAGAPVGAGEPAAELRVELCAGVHPVRRPLVLTAAADSPSQRHHGASTVATRRRWVIQRQRLIL